MMRILVSDDVSEKGVALLREHFDGLLPAARRRLPNRLSTPPKI